MWAMFGFKIGFGKVFANDTEEKELNAAEEHDNTDEARPAGGGVTKDESFNDDDNNDDESDETEDNAKESGKGERNGREGDDALDGIFEEFPE